MHVQYQIYSMCASIDYFDLDLKCDLNVINTINNVNNIFNPILCLIQFVSMHATIDLHVLTYVLM